MSSLPKEPPKELLMSMALRWDHALGRPGYYDQPFIKQASVTHKMKLDSTLVLMRKLYEEVAGYGFYKPENKEQYSELFARVADTGSYKSDDEKEI